MQFNELKESNRQMFAKFNNLQKEVATSQEETAQLGSKEAQESPGGSV